mgnify:FL=1
MRTELCERFGIEYPIFVFTPSEKVAAAVSKAGGLGVLGCVRFNDADDLENVLQWMDAPDMVSTCRATCGRKGAIRGSSDEE